ncbi:MAG: energy transducer TonB [Deltaproteobacteria bacterium]
MLDRPLQTALIISLAIHSALFLSLPKHFLDRRPENIRIAYLKTPPRAPYEAKPVIKKRELIKAKNRLHNAEQMIAVARANKSEFVRKQAVAPPPQSSEYIPKPFSAKDALPSFKKKVTLPAIEMGKVNNSPSYTGYYELVREKIRRAAYQNYGQTETGEVYLAFVIGSDGRVKNVSYKEDRSTPSYYLKDIAMRSIQEAAPFPAFPQDLDYPQLSFNVIISFQYEN